MLDGIINMNVDTYVSHVRLTKGTEVKITNYKSPSFYAIEYNKSIYLVPKNAVTIKKKEKTK